MTRERLLIIDDSQEMRDFLAETLFRPEGYEIEIARNGVEGLASALVNPPDLIITDLAMPEMDGLTMIEEMRRAGYEYPIILMTAEGSEAIAVRAMRAGVMDYFVKPFDPEMLKGSVERILRSTRIGAFRAGIPNQRRLEALNMLMAIAKSMTSLLDLEKVLGRVAEAAVYLSGAEEGTIMLVDRATGELYIRATKNMQEGLRNVRLPIKDSLAGRVVNTGEPLVISGQGAQKFKTQYLVQSLIYVPLKLKDEVIGVLGVHNREKTTPLSKEDAGLMASLADFAAIAIYNAQLYRRSELGRTRLYQIFNELRDPILVVDSAGRLVLSNPPAREFLDLAGKTPPEGKLLPELTTNRMLLEIATRAPDQFEEQVFVQTRDERIFNAVISPITNLGWAVVMQDITGIKQMDRRKNEFVASISHDLRSPLTAVLSYVELMSRGGNLTEQQLQFTEQVRQSVRTMTQLINDLLDVEKIETGLDREQEAVSLAQVLQKAVEVVRAKTDLKQQVLIFEPPQSPALVMGSAARLQQAFVNLLDNASKYTPEFGEIRLEMSEREGQVLASVIDTGIGIPLEDQPHIFERFYRARGVMDSHDGTGLGLSIVRSIVEAHNGRIWMESVPGKGTTFTVVLPPFTAGKASPATSRNAALTIDR